MAQRPIWLWREPLAGCRSKTLWPVLHSWVLLLRVTVVTITLTLTLTLTRFSSAGPDGLDGPIDLEDLELIECAVLWSRPGSTHQSAHADSNPNPNPTLTLTLTLTHPYP